MYTTAASGDTSINKYLKFLDGLEKVTALPKTASNKTSTVNTTDVVSEHNTSLVLNLVVNNVVNASNVEAFMQLATMDEKCCSFDTRRKLHSEYEKLMKLRKNYGGKYDVCRYLSQLRVAFDLVVPLMLEKGYATAEDVEGLMHLPELFNRTRKTIASKTLENAPVPPVSSADESETFRGIMEDESEEWFYCRGHNELELSVLCVDEEKGGVLRKCPVPYSLTKKCREIFNDYIGDMMNRPEWTFSGMHPRKNHFSNSARLKWYYKLSNRYQTFLFKIKRIRCNDPIDVFQRIWWLFFTYDLHGPQDIYGIRALVRTLVGADAMTIDYNRCSVELCAESDEWDPKEYYEIVYAPSFQERMDELTFPIIPPSDLSFGGGLSLRVRNNDGYNRKLYVNPKRVSRLTLTGGRR